MALRTAEEAYVNVHLNEAYDACARLTRSRAHNFYLAFLSLPSKMRRSVFALYAYCRLLDDIADGDGTAEEKRMTLQKLTDDMHDSIINRPTTPLFTALKDTIEQYSIPLSLFDDIAHGVTQDLVVDRYARFDDLKSYCYYVASAVGLATLEIFGYHHSDAKQAAVHMGIAMQLTNILRDVAEDGSRGRIYIPLEDLKRFGVSEEELLRPRPSPQFRKLIQFQVERAEDYYREARRLFDYLPRASRPCPMILLGVYHRILDKIRQNDYDCVSRRVTLPKSRIAMLAFGLGLRGLLWKPQT